MSLLEPRTTGVEGCKSLIIPGTKVNGVEWSRKKGLRHSMLEKIAQLFDKQQDGGFNEEADSFTRGDM
jgi:hypothetical protein